MLLQKRAMRKYHSGGLWSNACCSHPMEGEEIFSSAARRLKEETGIETPLEKIFDFVYKAAFENGLFEHEFDHVFAGIYDGDIALDAEEASDYTFKPMNAIRDELNTYPQKYTAWFHLAFEGAEKWYASHFEK
jgi:isopentenyl-diphosphate delta-isomerase